MSSFGYFSGVVTAIDDFYTQAGQANGCYKLMNVSDNNERTVNFVITPDTYFVDQALVSLGDSVTGYYDTNVPVPMIYPPQYQAVVMVRPTNYQNVKVDYFNSELLSGDGSLKLNLSQCTQLFLENGQPFTSSPENRNLVVLYGATTRSYPAQTTPYKIIVLCRMT